MEKLMKKLFIVLITMILNITTAMAFNFEWEKEFPWAVDAVNYCVQNSILEGDEYGDLMLSNKLSRSQMAKILCEAFNLEKKTSNPYRDTLKNSWDYVYISSVYEYMPDNGTYFDGTGKAKREDFIVTIMNICNIKEYKTDILMQFSDVAKTTPEYRGLLAAAVNKGILTGDGGNIKPRTNLTRAEACTLLFRAINKMGTQNTTPPDDTPSQSTYDTSIKGEAQITLEQAKAWAKDRGASEKYINVAEAYWHYGALMGIRPEILYAQAGWETNYGKYTGVVSEDMNNWAGIKVYGRNDDEKDAHETFATPEEGARGHFNHMAAYVGVEPYGEPHARYHSVKTTAWAGTVKTLEELGGKWCPDTEYGIKILENCLIPMSKY